MASITPRKESPDPKHPDAERAIIGYQARVRKNGYPVQVKTFRKRSDAEAWARKVESEMERGLWRDSTEAEATTLRAAFDRYAKDVTPTKRCYQPELAKIRHWKSMPIAKVALSRIGGKDIAAAVRDMEKEGKSPNTIRLHLAVLSHLYKVARTEWGMTTLVNPVDLIRKPRLPHGRDRRLQEGEEDRLLAACAEAHTPWLLPVVQFAIETGMRAGEILETKEAADKVTGERKIRTPGLTWGRVNSEKRTVYLPGEITKNTFSREVPLSSKALQILQDLPGLRATNAKVFDTTYEAIHLAFVRACKRAGIKDLRFHDLRHEATSRLFEKGLNPMQVAAITGHKTLQMLKRYTHLRAEDLAKLLA